MGPLGEDPPMKVEVRAGQLWEFTDRSGATRRGFVVRVSDPIDGVRHVFLRRVGSGLPMRATLRRMERQAGGLRLIEDHEASQPPEPAPARKVQTSPRPQLRCPTLRQPRMSADDRREAIATARRLQAHGRTLGEIGEALSVLPEIVEGWLREEKDDASGSGS
jgi:hypothetical protein